MTAIAPKVIGLTLRLTDTPVKKVTNNFKQGFNSGSSGSYYILIQEKNLQNQDRC
jgi:hypothetical protein